MKPSDIKARNDGLDDAIDRFNSIFVHRAKMLFSFEEVVRVLKSLKEEAPIPVKYSVTVVGEKDE